LAHSSETEIPLADTIYDLVVLGGGPAGYTCAIRASQYGLKAALIRRERPAGRHMSPLGLRPDQGDALLRRAMGPPQARGPLRIDVAAPKLNWKNVLARKDDVISRHTKGLDF